MQDRKEKEDFNDTALYPIRTVSELTGVNAVTLRAWERRHDLFEPVRKPSGHRLYTQQHIDLITRVVGLLDRGMRIGQIKAQLDVDEMAPGAETAVHSAWKRQLDQMIAAVIQFNEARLEEVYSEALSLYPVEEVTEKLLIPLLRELGRRWEENQGSIAEEHFFCFYIRNKLGARFHHRVKAKDGPRLILSCLPGDRHETGLLLFALAANSAGYTTILLGADMPLGELPATVRKTGASAVILSGVLKPDLEFLNLTLPALMKSIDVPVFLGGQSSVYAHDAIKRADVHVLGSDLNQGLAKVCKIVPLGE